MEIIRPYINTVGNPAYANDINGDFSNNYDDSTVDSNNATTNETNNYNAAGASQAAPVMSAIAPTVWAVVVTIVVYYPRPRESK